MRLAPLLLLLAGLTAYAKEAEPLPDPATVSDGPYVVHGDQSSEAWWVCAGKVEKRPVAAKGALAAPCGEAAKLELMESLTVSPDVLPQPERWAALSDIHGQAGVFEGLLKAHGVIDAKGDWAWGRGVLVIAGDIFDRGPTVNEALWRVYQLERQAKAAGGAVHFVLGNHETMVLRGDVRYIHPKYQVSAKLLERGYDQLYGKDTEIGRWLRHRATVLKLGDTVFLHGGLHPKMADAEIDLKAINQRFRDNLGAGKAELEKDPQAKELFGAAGPIWFRGYFMANQVSLADVEKLLARLSARRIVVGHTTQPELLSLYGGRVIGVDAGMKNGERGELLIWQDNKLWRGTQDGKRVELPPGNPEGGRE